MRPYHSYTPDQAALLPRSLEEAVAPGDPVRLLRDLIGRLDLEAFHTAYRCERGRPPFHPLMMVSLFLYGASRGVYSSRRLADSCAYDVRFMYLSAQAQPDFHTIAVFRRRFRGELNDLFGQVLGLCAEAGLVRLGHVSLDGTKVRANASKHKSMTYGRMLARKEALAAEIKRLLDEGERQDEIEDEEYGRDDDGYSLPEELREPEKRLAKINAALERLRREAEEKRAEEGKDPELAQVREKAQSNFTDPESRMMQTTEGFQQSYNAQVAVDGESQVIVACEVSQAAGDFQRLQPMLKRIVELNDHPPNQLTADAGYASESNFAALHAAAVHSVIALRRYHRDEPPDADPDRHRASSRYPHRNEMRRRLSSREGKALYKLRKQTVEPVIGQIKAARGFRQFLCRGLDAVQAEWNLVCTAHNLLKLQKALAAPG